jgi:phage repressor protein C with HTH and peptisase S24 domain
MKPEIYPGDIIGVSKIDRWEKVDPDKVYMIITHEERMLKHLRTDNERNDILWCISPNYKEFSIQKEDIKTIYKVVFVGRLM